MIKYFIHLTNIYELPTMCHSLFMAWGEKDKVLFLLELTFHLFVKFKSDNMMGLLTYRECPVNEGYCLYLPHM